MNKIEKYNLSLKIGKIFFFVFIGFGFILGIGGPILMNFVGIDMCPYKNIILEILGFITSGTTIFYILSKHYKPEDSDNISLFD